LLKQLIHFSHLYFFRRKPFNACSSRTQHVSSLLIVIFSNSISVVAGWLLLADGPGQVLSVLIRLPYDNDGVDIVATLFHSVTQSKVLDRSAALPCFSRLSASSLSRNHWKFVLVLALSSSLEQNKLVNLIE
jgi:hypothetical protein